MNIPNILSTVRIVVSLFAPVLLIYGGFWMRVAVGVVCIFAVLTDWFDGWYARKYNLVTKLGKILDPIADKTYVIITFSVLAYLDMFSIWWVVPIFIREIVITVYRFIFLARGVVVAAAKSGKLKTVFQMGTIGLIYILFMLERYYPDYFINAFYWVMYACLAITLFLTIQSGIEFFRNNWRLVKSVHNA